MENHHDELKEKEFDNDKNLHLTLAHLLWKHFNNHQGARYHYLEALEIDFDSINAHCNLAILFEQYLNDYHDAKYHYLETIRIDNNYKYGHYNLALMIIMVQKNII